MASPYANWIGESWTGPCRTNGRRGNRPRIACEYVRAIRDLNQNHTSAQCLITHKIYANIGNKKKSGLKFHMYEFQKQKNKYK